MKRAQELPALALCDVRDRAGVDHGPIRSTGVMHHGPAGGPGAASQILHFGLIQFAAQARTQDVHRLVMIALSRRGANKRPSTRTVSQKYTGRIVSSGLLTPP